MKLISSCLVAALLVSLLSDPAHAQAGGAFGGRAGGRQRLQRKGGSPIAEAIHRGLTWLAKHQDEDGRFGAATFGERCESAPKCAGPGDAAEDVTVTSLALLAFLADGSTLTNGPHRTNIRRGVEWLRKHQGKDGNFTPGRSSKDSVAQSFATLAMCEAYLLSQAHDLKEHVERSVRYLCRLRNDAGAWGAYARSRRGSTVPTVHAIVALWSARTAGLEVPDDALDDGRSYIEGLTDPKGRTQEERSRKDDTADASATAAALFASFLFQGRVERVPSADLVLSHPPEWKAGRTDMIRNYFATYAMYQQGGRHWKQHRKALETALVPTQIAEGEAEGSWNPIGIHGKKHGRVGTTALAVLSLQVYYRYTRVVR